MMAKKVLIDDIGQYHDQGSILKQIKYDTTKVLQEIRNSACLPQDSDSTYEIPNDDLDVLSRICETSPTIVVFGQSLYAKVVVVNELLGQAVLPCEFENADLESWRTVRLKYGIYGVSVVLPDSYVLPSKLCSLEREGHFVSKDDLVLKENEKSDPTSALSVAEVTLPHPILKAGAQIICTSSNINSYIQNLDEQVKGYNEKAITVLIYAIEHKELSEQVTKFTFSTLRLKLI